MMGLFKIHIHGLMTIPLDIGYSLGGECYSSVQPGRLRLINVETIGMARYVWI